MNKDLGVLLLGVGVLALAVVTLVKDPVNVEVVSSDGRVEVVERTFGAASGPEHTELQLFKAGYVKGGAVTASSSAGTAGTLLANTLFPRGGEYVTRYEITPTGGNFTLTLPASSTLSHVLPDNGDTFSFVVENEATAATTTTIAAGAGMDLQEPDGQNVVIGQNNFAVITMQRDEDTDFIVWVDETIPAD